MPVMGTAKRIDAGLIWRADELHGRTIELDSLGGNRYSFFLVGGIGAVVAQQDEVFACIGGDHELLRCSASDGSAVGIDGHRGQTTALKNSAIGLIHVQIGVLEIGLAGMKGIGVFHDEFPPTHEPETGANFIPKFGLDLVKVHRQLFVGLQKVPSEAGHDFFMGWP